VRSCAIKPGVTTMRPAQRGGEELRNQTQRDDDAPRAAGR
jgi:hypothetical protein